MPWLKPGEQPELPFQRVPTSELAALLAEPNADTQRRAVLDHLRKLADWGATDEELQDALGLGGNTQRPRRRELVLAGLIVDSGLTRKTQSGRAAVVWISTSSAPDRR